MVVVQHITLNDIRIAYSVSGTGPPIVFLHGWACNKYFWENQVRAFRETHQVVTPDFRGHGESEAPSYGYTLKHMAEDIHRLISKLNIRPAAVIGHSMGGMVAQQLAILYPSDLSALGLIATTGSDPENQLISARIASETPRLGYEAALERFFPSWFSSNTSDDIKNWVKYEMLKTPEYVALNLVDNYKDLDFSKDLVNIPVPTIVIGASADASTSVTRSEEIATQIPGSKLVIITRSGHFIQVEQPDAVNKALRIFLDEHHL